MFSPALRHQQKIKAAEAARAAGESLIEGAAPPMSEDGPGASEYQQLLARQHDDLRALAQIQSRETKTARKAEMLPAYLPWCEGALQIEEGAQAPQDDIVVTSFIWAVDVGDWANALKLGEHVTAHGLQLPERFHRTAGGFLISQLADAAIDKPGSVDREIIRDTLNLLSGATGPSWDMKDETRARLHRAYGEALSREADAFDPQAESAEAGGKPMLVSVALDHLRRATELDPKVGVKKQIEALEREQKKLAPKDTAGSSGA